MYDWIVTGGLIVGGVFLFIAGLSLTSAVMACLMVLFHHDDWVRERRHFYQQMRLPEPALAPLPNPWGGMPPVYSPPITLEAT